MTTEEIKHLHLMKEIVERYGIIIDKKGFAQCPFHTEKTASLKVYKNSYNCFGCGANGDIFTFIQQMDNLSFKEAYQSLGGGYEHSFSAKVKIYNAKKDREKKEREYESLKKDIQLNSNLISVYRKYFNKSDVFSDEWCKNYNLLQYQLYIHETLNEKR